MEIIRGKQPKALKLLVYGPEGIGKSTFASQMPKPVFIDTEGSTTHMDVARTPTPKSWSAVKQQVQYFISHPDELGTLVIDTADWAEKLCVKSVCSEKNVSGIEDFGYGKGYVYVEEEFARFLHMQEELVARGVNVCLTAHALVRKFELPEEQGAYDRWGLKLTQKVASLCKEWSDIILFANYKIFVVNVDNNGAQKGKNKASGGQRVMHTCHHPCWDGKNRFGLPEELPFDYQQIAHLFQPAAPKAAAQAPAAEPASPPQGIAPQLWQLMQMHGVTEAQIQKAVTARGYYPANTPIANYDPAFVEGVLVGAWDQVHKMILEDK